MITASALLPVLALGVFVWLATEMTRRWLGVRRRSRRVRRALKKERQAGKLLERNGYTIVDHGSEARLRVWLDGAPFEAELRADYLVTRGGKSYVAEVKAGSLVASLRHAPTRRQLLEYQLVYRVDGVLLVDMVERRVMAVQFAELFRSRHTAWRRVAWTAAWVLAVCSGGVVGWTLEQALK